MKNKIKILICIFFVVSFGFSKKSMAESPNIYELQAGLNIIAIDLGGDIDSDRANGAYGDAAIIEQNGNYLLIDTGGDDKNNVLTNFLKSQGINCFSIYVSHYHGDHYGKIKDIARDDYFTINNIYLPNPDIIQNKLDSSKEWYSTIYGYVEWFWKFKNTLINEFGENVVIIEKGSTINIGEATLEVIWDLNQSSLTPNEFYKLNVNTYENRFINDTSLVSMINYRGIKFLTAGDLEKKAEKEILNANLDIKADIFKFSHHSGINSNTDEFIDKINPKYAYFPNNYVAGNNNIIWCGDRDGGIYRDFVDNLASKTNILSTLYNGNIIYNISPDGEITTKVTRNYNTLIVKYIDENNEDILEPIHYPFNDRSVYHLDTLNYIKDIDDYIFLNSTYTPNNILTEDDTVICYYRKKAIYDDILTNEAKEIKKNISIQNEDIDVLLINSDSAITKETFIENNFIVPESGKIEILDKNNNVIINGEKIGSYSTITIYDRNDNIVALFKIAVKGDVTGNGEIKIFDAFTILINVVSNTEILDEMDILIRDFNGDGKVKIYDAFIFLIKAIS